VYNTTEAIITSSGTITPSYLFVILQTPSVSPRCSQVALDLSRSLASGGGGGGKEASDLGFKSFDCYNKLYP
jgi:hypothetical protein